MLTKPVTIRDAKAHLDRLIERAGAGEDVVIARGSKPAVRLVPVTAEPAKRQFGSMKGRARTSPAFFEPLDESEFERWGT